MKTKERRLAERWVTEAQDIAIEHEQATGPADDVKAIRREKRLVDRITRRLRPWDGR